MFFRRRSWYCTVRRHKWELLTAGILIAVLCMVVHRADQTASYAPSNCEPIDVVYTWVNGTDPAFISSLGQFSGSYEKARFDDKNELKYSLRSLERFAPWVRHIYIVTNGQIPKWLDLTNKRLTVVPHEILVQNVEWLPTFSSAAIETFLHRIPNLSRRFLYLNDDIFLGTELYPEDLYTDSEGVKVYQAWLVPDCAEDCPWTYIGDGACDRHCNLHHCQYDGGDCMNISETQSMESDTLKMEEKSGTSALRKDGVKLEIKEFPRKTLLTPAKNTRNYRFKDIIGKHTNLTDKTDFKSVVEGYNKRLKEQTQNKKQLVLKKEKAAQSRYISKDIYSQSLIYTNMLLNRRYGFKARHVVSHVGFLLEKSIIEAMQKEFAQEILATASHRFREPDDLQFAFVYYSFLMEQSKMVAVQEIFNEFDTDHSLTWSDREIRTFLAKIFPLPLDWSAVRFFEDVIQNCSLAYPSASIDNKKYTTLFYERYEDSNLPTISRNFVEKCVPLAKALEANFAMRPAYKFHINPKRNVHSNFIMLTSNVTDVVDALDKIRQSPRKFNCINDNLDTQSREENELIRHLLEDFYLSLFPHQSEFELQPQYRNRFENWRDYLKWRRQQRAFLVVIYGSCVFAIAYIMRSVCIYKTKFVSRCIQKL